MNINEESEWIEHPIIKLEDEKSIIYIIYNKKDEIIYIGQTINFFLRIGTHLKEKKDIEKVKYFFVKTEDCLKIENDMILKYCPKYNSKGKVYKDEKKITSLKDYLNHYNISVHKFSQRTFINREYLRDVLLKNIIPTLEMAKIIEKETNGEVTVSELMRDRELVC